VNDQQLLADQEKRETERKALMLVLCSQHTAAIQEGDLILDGCAYCFAKASRVAFKRIITALGKGSLHDLAGIATMVEDLSEEKS
jgi:hypothetical protein